jgi:hypothetical protein
MSEQIVAVSTAKKGGPCAKCKVWITKFGFIAKVGTEGQTTSKGQGPGYWVCEPCSNDYPWTEDAEVNRKVAFRDYRPDIYDELDLTENAPRGFQVGMKYSKYQQIAYQLGYYHGHSDAKEHE